MLHTDLFLKDYKECCEACKKEWGCVVFTWDANGNVCDLKYNDRGRTQNKGAVSGHITQAQSEAKPAAVMPAAPAKANAKTNDLAIASAAAKQAVVMPAAAAQAHTKTGNVATSSVTSYH